MEAVDRKDRRSQLLSHLRHLEEEFARTHAELAIIGAGQRLPGVYLVFDVAGFVATVPAIRIIEIVRLVATSPVPQAPSYVLGTFLYRGDPVVAVDLAAFLGRHTEPALDSNLLVIRGSRLMALVVDRARSLVEAPTIVSRDSQCDQIPEWFSSKLVSGLCQSGDDLLPILDIEMLLEGVNI